MPSNIPTNPGNAQIKKQGHTYSGKHGDNPNSEVRGSDTVKDLSVKAK